jgi:pyruvate dehydrogenase E1 component
MAALPKSGNSDIAHDQLADFDPVETREWLDAMAGVIATEGTERAAYLIDQQISFARVNGVDQPFHAQTPYINTIPVDRQARIP